MNLTILIEKIAILCYNAQNLKQKKEDYDFYKHNKEQGNKCSWKTY